MERFPRKRVSHKFQATSLPMSSFFKLIRPFLRFEWYTRVPMGAPACAWAPVPRAIALRTFDRHLTPLIDPLYVHRQQRTYTVTATVRAIPAHQRSTTSTPEGAPVKDQRARAGCWHRSMQHLIHERCVKACVRAVGEGTWMHGWMAGGWGSAYPLDPADLPAARTHMANGRIGMLCVCCIRPFARAGTQFLRLRNKLRCNVASAVVKSVPINERWAGAEIDVGDEERRRRRKEGRYGNGEGRGDADVKAGKRACDAFSLIRKALSATKVMSRTGKNRHRKGRSKSISHLEKPTHPTWPCASTLRPVSHPGGPMRRRADRRQLAPAAFRLPDQGHATRKNHAATARARHGPAESVSRVSHVSGMRFFRFTYKLIDP